MPLFYGNTDATPSTSETVSGLARNDSIVTGLSNGASDTEYQRLYGGAGQDTFAFRARDFAVDDTNPNVVNKFIADFEGAKGIAAGGSNGGDFLSLRQFGAGAQLELQDRSFAGSKEGAVVYTYHIVSGDELLGVFNIQSLNGQVLGTGDYSFY